jgi:anti-sigma factor RsiW
MNGDVNRADCALVDRWLDDWLAGRLHADTARRIEQHVAGCARCRQLAAIVSGDEADTELPADGLLSAVLNQTIGSPCARAETLLPALVDEELNADSREILQAHLAHCDGCSRLLGALQ